MENENCYISRKEAIRKGYTRGKGGVYYKKTVLEKYYDTSYLNIIESEYSAAERKKAGELLVLDYYFGHNNQVRSSGVGELYIRSTGESGKDTAYMHQKRYLQAISSIPVEFWPAVRTVCIEDKELVGEYELPKKNILNKHSVYHQKMLLCLGLDRLVKFYQQKNEKRT